MQSSLKVKAHPICHKNFDATGLTRPGGWRRHFLPFQICVDPRNQLAQAPFEWQRGMTCDLKSDEEWWRVKTIFVTSIPSGYRPLAKGKNKPSHAHASPRGTQTCSAFIKQDWDSYHAGKLMQRMQQVQQVHSAQCPCRNTLSKKCLTTFPFSRNIYIYIYYICIYIKSINVSTCLEGAAGNLNQQHFFGISDCRCWQMTGCIADYKMAPGISAQRSGSNYDKLRELQIVWTSLSTFYILLHHR